ncbi:hypothetical protein [Telmatospirillum siberiense]|nr:hypothetical protein [Telmatospirillum siberiense]
MSSVQRPPALFLHSAFRSGSTWFWNRFRKAAGTCAYYEPFNEVLASLDPQMVADHRPDTWPAGHPALDAPYYAEYAPLLRPDGGVRGYQRRFAYQSYFDDGRDEDQLRYFALLTDHAGRSGLVPVLGFCRSLARLPWLRRHCPGLHLVTWRNPWDQWASYHHLALSHQSSYFEFRAFLIASFGRCHERYRDFFADLYLPPLLAYTSGDNEAFLDFFFRASHVDHRFRIFLRVFMFDMLNALPHADVVVDLDRMSAEAPYRQAMTESLRIRTGLPDLRFDDCALPRHGWLDDGAYLSGLDDALDFLGDWEKRASAAGIGPAAIDDLKGRLTQCRNDMAAAARAGGTSGELVPGQSDLDRYTLCQVLFAIGLMVRPGGSPEDGLAHLRSVFGADFCSLRDDLLRALDLVEGLSEPSRQETQRLAARQLGRMLTGEEVGPQGI